MKKIFFKTVMALFAVVATSTTLSAQGAYGTLNIGYGFNAAPETNQNITLNVTSYASTYSAEAVNNSLGNGLNLGGAIGYMLNKNIGAELGVNYLLGDKTETKQSTTYEDDPRYNGNSTYTTHANMFRLIPTIVLTTGMDKINPYAKFGAILGSGTIYSDSEHIYTNRDEVNNIKYEKTGGLAFGYTASIGANYSLNEKIALFGEINLITMSYAPTKGEMTQATLNGESYLDDLSIREKKTEYVEKVNNDWSTANPDAPREELLTKNAFSSIGVNFGIKYNF